MAAAAVPLMIASTAVQGFGTIIGAIQSRQQANFAAEQQKNNAILIERQAQRAKEIADVEKGFLADRANRQRGSARAAFGGGNVVLGQGSALESELDITRSETFDRLAIESNLDAEVYDLGLQRNNALTAASVQESRGRNAITSGILNTGSTLLGGASEVALFKNRKKDFQG